jgi:nucleoid DNA-binding protein
MNKPELLKHLQRAAERATPRKKLNGVHVRVITDELVRVWTKSLQETGKAGLAGLGRFHVDKKTGDIKFRASTLWKDQVAGSISSSSRAEDELEDDDY